MGPGCLESRVFKKSPPSDASDFKLAQISSFSQLAVVPCEDKTPRTCEWFCFLNIFGVWKKVMWVSEWMHQMSNAETWHMNDTMLWESDAIYQFNPNIFIFCKSPKVIFTFHDGILGWCALQDLHAPPMDQGNRLWSHAVVFRWLGHSFGWVDGYVWMT